MYSNVLVLSPEIPSLVVPVIHLYFLMAVNKGLEHLSLERHRKISHCFNQYPLAPCRGGFNSCSHYIDYSIALAW